MAVTPIDVKSVVQFVRDCGPVTATELRFAFTYPTETFAAEALKLVEHITGEVSQVAGYWTASVVEE